MNQSGFHGLSAKGFVASTGSWKDGPQRLDETLSPVEVQNNHDMGRDCLFFLVQIDLDYFYAVTMWERFWVSMMAFSPSKLGVPSSYFKLQIPQHHSVGWSAKNGITLTLDQGSRFSLRMAIQTFSVGNQFFFLANSVKTAATRNFINWWVNCTTWRYTSWIHLSETTSYMSRVLSVAPTVFDTTKPRLDGGQYVLKDACLLWIKWLKRSMLWFAVLLVCIGWIWLEGSFLHRCVLVSLLWRPK